MFSFVFPEVQNADATWRDILTRFPTLKEATGPEIEELGQIMADWGPVDLPAWAPLTKGNLDNQNWFAAIQDPNLKIEFIKRMDKVAVNPNWPKNPRISWDIGENSNLKLFFSLYKSEQLKEGKQNDAIAMRISSLRL